MFEHIATAHPALLIVWALTFVATAYFGVEYVRLALKGGE